LDGNLNRAGFRPADPTDLARFKDVADGNRVSAAGAIRMTRKPGATNAAYLAESDVILRSTVLGRDNGPESGPAGASTLQGHDGASLPQGSRLDIGEIRRSDFDGHSGRNCREPERGNPTFGPIDRSV
jgi:hypothetical protein